MAVIISSDIVLTDTVLSGERGLLCYRNYATSEAISATSETVENPASNLANPATAWSWVASSAASQTITVTLDGQEIDYIGIARHNLNQAGLTLTIKFDGATVHEITSVTDDQSVLFLNTLASPTTVTLEIDGATDAPSIGVLYVGLSTQMQRNVYVGHTPIVYGRQRSSVNGMSENGQYLGEIVVRESIGTSVSLSNLTPEWYRSTLDPYFAMKPRPPCFWAWRPLSYPSEAGYAWIEGNPSMSNQRANGMVEANFTLRGIS